ncbi:complexin-4-like isoform X2 [Amblyraja radiata]|uniref:complexin-4-like isoform X2 n=1 Tax=Amblyraja radiata TaxID=386614 RepID=UPI0014035911|nr:complexin-4-like isoform X2 [Amblyraja radiata]
MAILLKSMISGKIKDLGGGGGEEDKATEGDGKPTPQSTGMTRDEFEEYQRQLLEEKIERDNAFTQKKAERATIRLHMRGKYRLPQNDKDENQLQMAGGDVDLPEDLAKMMQEDEEDEEASNSILGSIQNMDFDTLKVKAQETFTEMKQTAEEKCSVM